MEHLTNNKGTIAAVVGVLAVAFFIVTNVMVNSSAEPFKPAVESRTSTPTVEANYFVTVGDVVVYTDAEGSLTREAAGAHCEEIAYAAENMWKQVVCTYAGEEFYNDIFVAG